MRERVSEKMGDKERNYGVHARRKARRKIRARGNERMRAKTVGTEKKWW